MENYTGDVENADFLSNSGHSERLLWHSRANLHYLRHIFDAEVLFWTEKTQNSRGIRPFLISRAFETI